MSDQLRVGEAIIDLLTREYGVDTVFGIPGVHNIELYRGLHRSGVQAISLGTNKVQVSWPMDGLLLPANPAFAC